MSFCDDGNAWVTLMPWVFLSAVVLDGSVGVSVVFLFLEPLMCHVLFLESASIVLLLFGLDGAPSFAGRTVWDDDSGEITCCKKMAKADLFPKSYKRRGV